MTKEKQDAAAKKRSAAAKKAAATRKKKAAEKTATTTEITSSTATDQRVEAVETGQQAEGLSEYKPKQRPLKAAGLDQHAEHAKRKAERDAEREEHNQRTGDVSRQGWNH